MGMNDFYITLLFPGAAVIREADRWHIAGVTGIRAEDIRRDISGIGGAKQVSEDMYRVHGFIELYLHCRDKEAEGIYLKCSFAHLEDGIERLYGIMGYFREKYFCTVLIRDEECKPEGAAGLEADIKRVYREKYEFFCRSVSVISGRKRRQKLLK